jgi:hypothetical protein
MSGSLKILADSLLVEERKSLSQRVMAFNPPVHYWPVCVTFSDRGPDHFRGATGIGAMRVLTMEWSS